MKRHIREAIANAATEIGDAPVWGEYETVSPRARWEATYYSHPAKIELYLAPTSDFTSQGWGKAVEDAGGDWGSISQMDLYRLVALPYCPETRALVQALSVAFQARALAFRAPVGFVVEGRISGWSSKVPRATLRGLEGKYLDALLHAVRNAHLMTIDISTEQKRRERELLLAWRQHHAAAAAAERLRGEINRAKRALAESERLLIEAVDTMASTAASSATWDLLVEVDGEAQDAKEALRRSL